MRRLCLSLALALAGCVESDAPNHPRPGTPAVDLVASVERGRVLAAAGRALAATPLTITAYPAKLSEGGRNDFYSNGDYWWPDPAKPNGLPYIRRDGQTNPENFVQHRNALNGFRDHVAALAAAYRLTHDEKYAVQAVKFLDVFLLDAGTRMNPHLKYAQAIPGRSPGRGIGIIDTLHLIEIPPAIQALRGSPALTAEREAGLRRWFNDYKDWMLASDNGKEEANEKNNHAVAFWLQVAVFANFTDDQAALAECRTRFTQKFIAGQMAMDGGFPLELARTKPYAYSLFQLDNLATLGWVLTADRTHYWRHTLPDGRGLAKGVDFMTPFVADKSRWTRPPDVQAWEGWPSRPVYLLFAGIALERPALIDLWKRLDGDPTDPEVRRNRAITQPLLWVK
ncbi:MAG: hypothetical protein RL636_1268 [Verrucomicrobiota bacterium]|jgi:hypothetical protein